MPAYNSRQKEIHFLGVNLWAWGALITLVIASILNIIFIFRGDTTPLFIFVPMWLSSTVTFIVTYRFNNRLFELNFVVMSGGLKNQTLSWMCKGRFDDKTL